MIGYALEDNQCLRSSSAMARSRSAPSGRGGDRHYARRQTRRQAGADRGAAHTTQAIRSGHPREVAAKCRGRPALALGRSGRPGFPRGSARSTPAAVIYLDTSCLLKLPLEEPESEAVRLAVAREAELIISALTELETAVQLRAGWRGGEYRERRYRA